jgi:hypothetical protein
MDIEKLKEALKPWLALETWHTGHPLDDKRFHRCLKAVFDNLGVHISSDDFRQAIVLGLNDFRPNDAKLFKNDVEEYAQRGEDVASYLIDLKP